MAPSSVVVAFSPAANADLCEAVDWYEDQAGLGESIQSAVLHAMKSVALAPDRWPVRDPASWEKRR